MHGMVYLGVHDCILRVCGNKYGGGGRQYSDNFIVIFNGWRVIVTITGYKIIRVVATINLIACKVQGRLQVFVLDIRIRPLL
jgi:hypothetical protein